jgi:simple sugar transport system ATP-binding protein
MAEPILSVDGVEKIYPDGTIANHDVSFEVVPQSVHAIVGENGAGKTTLMKILFGMEQSQRGEVHFMGELHQPASPHEAIRRGVGMVHQHLMLAPDLTVAENLILGVEPLHKRLFLDRKRISRVAREVSERYGLPVPPDALIRELPVGIRQRVEILKALYRDARLLILDEPTAVLTPQESEGLFRTLDTLKAEGKTILFISHKLDEVTRVADRVTIMRAGTVVETTAADGLDKATIAQRMVGRQIDFRRVAAPNHVGDVLLTAKGLGHSDKDGVPVVKDVSFEVRSGEILGVAGVEGNGQTEVVRILTGLLQPDRGSVSVGSVALAGLPPRKVREHGVGHIPEDRMEDGAATEASIRENLIVDRYYRAPFSKFGRILSRETSALSRRLIADYEIHCRDEQQPIGSLSGGNIQKCVVARELSADPEVIVASQPTRGVDIGSWERIHELLVDARDRGKGVFLVSADLDELLKLSTRIVVIYNGEIVARFDDTAELTPEDLGPYMLGVERKEAVRG